MLQFFFAFLLCSTYCSAQNTTGNSTQPGDDKTNWEEIFKAMNASGMARTDDANLDIFETILRVNAIERGTGIGRTDTDVFLFEGDIQVSKKEIIGSEYPNANRKRRALIRNNGRNLWGRTIYYVLDRGLGGRARGAIASAIREWRNTLPCITWTDITGQNPGQRSYMHFFVGGGCYSQVGRVGRGQKVSIGRGCDFHGIAVHEIGHAMGLWHEQSRPDRDSYVRINWQNIIPATRFNFQKQPVSRVNSLNVGYDYESVMHYGATAFAKASGLITIERLRGSVHQRRRLGQRVGLSAKDKLQVQRLYKCGTTATTLAPSGCRNKVADSNCERWSKAGFCKSGSQYYSYMKENCCKSCSCKDASSHSKWCIESKKLSLCQNNLFKSYMEQYCCKSCKPTPAPTTRPTTAIPCVDKVSGCAGWKNRGYCTHTYVQYMTQNCAKTCGRCLT